MTGGSFFTGTGFAHYDAAASQFGAVESFDSSLRFLVIDHLYKTESLGTGSTAIDDDFGQGNCPKRLKGFSQIVVSRAEGNVAYIYFHYNIVSQMEILLIESRPSIANFKECPDSIEGEEYFTFKR